MNDLVKLVEAWMSQQKWLIYEKGEKNCNSFRSDEFDRVSDVVLNLPFDQPELAWDFIQSACGKTSDPLLLGSLAAGPLEDLLAQHGEDFIDRVEAVAARDECFRELLNGVWRSTIPEIVWKRIERLRSIS